MRSILLSGALAVGALTFAAAPQAEASWLSQALRSLVGQGHNQAPYGSYGRQHDHGYHGHHGHHGHGGYQNGPGFRPGPNGNRGYRDPVYGGYSNGYRGLNDPRYGTSSPYQYAVPPAAPRGYYQPAPYYYGR